MILIPEIYNAPHMALTLELCLSRDGHWHIRTAINCYQAILWLGSFYILFMAAVECSGVSSTGIHLPKYVQVSHQLERLVTRSRMVGR